MILRVRWPNQQCQALKDNKTFAIGGKHSFWTPSTIHHELETVDSNLSTTKEKEAQRELI